MRFYVQRANRSEVRAKVPYAVLREDPDQRERFKTLYSLTLYLERRVVKLGDVRIMRLGMDDASLEFRSLPFTEVPSDFFSLGQKYTYYEELVYALPLEWRDVLEGLHDVALDAARLEEVRDTQVFRTSLMRSQAAERALLDARELFEVAAQEPLDEGTFWMQEQASAREAGLEFQFKTSVGGGEFFTDFSFGDSPYLPDRTVGIIGYNGVGKTKLLANLAMVAQAHRSQRSSPEYREYGTFGLNGLAFGAVIAVSYSAFDTFDFPSSMTNERSVYTYCGLRDPRRPTTERRLKGSDAVRRDFTNALEEARSEGRRELLSGVLEAIAAEPSFSEYSLDSFTDFSVEVDDPEITDQYRRMSTGHQIVLNIVVQLVSRLQLQSLVLIDEPESHLHPPLLAALMRAIAYALEVRESYAVVATHSPVVIQEIPARYVRVLRRTGSLNWIETPETETFGENVGHLTSTVFSLDSTATDYHDVLRALAHRLPLEQIEALFEGDIPAPARAFMVSVQRGLR